MALIARSAGAHVLSASIHKPDAFDIPHLDQGLLAKALLQGLNGEAESLLHIQVPRTGSSARDRIVSIKSLTAWTEKTLPKLSQAYGMPPVSPVAFSQNQDFPLVINRWDE